MHPPGAAALLTFGGARPARPLAIGQGAGNGMLTVAKGVLPLSLYGPRNYAYRSALIGRPALFAQIFGPAVFAPARWSARRARPSSAHPPSAWSCSP